VMSRNRGFGTPAAAAQQPTRRPPAPIMREGIR
jgi:hypothetical protein